MESLMTQKDFKKVHRFFLKAKKDPKSGGIDTIKAVDEILQRDPKTGAVRKRTIRLIEGQTSVYADEQVLPSSLELKDIDRMIYRFKFQDGIYNVAAHDVNKLDFLRLCNFNLSNELRDPSKPVLFYEQDLEKMAKNANEIEDLRIEAEYKAKNMTFEEVKTYLLAMADTADKIKWTEEQPAEVLRHEIRAMAKRNPKNFLKGIDSVSVKNKAKVMNGLSLGIVKLSPDNQLLSWPDGTLILQAPLGRNAVDYLVEKGAVDVKYQEVIEEINERSKYSVHTSEKVESAPSITAALGDGKNEYQILYDRLKAAGVLKHRGVKVAVEDQEWPTYKTFINEMQNNEDLYIDMRKRLRAAIQ